MKIGILVSFMNNFGQKGLYNSQEIGLAKALSKLGHKVIIFKLIKYGAIIPQNKEAEGISIQYYPVKNIGANGIVKTDILDTGLDKLVYFSDTQLSVPHVYRWCKTHNILFIPYIGVVESHSTSKFYKVLLDILFQRNLKIYKKNKCLVKTNGVKKILERKGVNRIEIAPVGIDFDLLNCEYKKMSRDEAKKGLCFCENEKIVLLIGRLEADRNPLDAVKVFWNLYNYDSNYRLVVVGKGALKESLFLKLKEYKIEEAVKFFEQIPNDRIWKIYRASDILITFSKTEIFGMSILEAMYYETVVHAVSAPGPNDIIEEGKSGYLYSNSEEMTRKICNNLVESEFIAEYAHDRIVNQFSWENTAKQIEMY